MLTSWMTSMTLALFWIATIYNYALIVTGLVFLVRVARSGTHFYRRQTRIIMLGAAVPIAGNILYLMGVQPLPGLDLTPVFFSITGVGHRDEQRCVDLPVAGRP